MRGIHEEKRKVKISVFISHRYFVHKSVKTLVMESK